MTARTISIIMPAFNEGDHIYNNIEITRRILADTGYTVEIVAVDDGSSDNTLAEIERAAKTFGNVVPARNPYNMGKGMALRTGFDYSSGDVIVFLDADLDLHPSQIRVLIDALDAGPYDIAVTSKHHPESKLDYPRSRKIVSLIYYLLIKTMFGLPVRDTQTGLKVFRREVLGGIFHRLLVKKFAYDVELLAVAVRFGYTVTEIPVVLEYRRKLKWGRIRLGDVLHILVDTMAVLYRLRIVRYYDVERPPFRRANESVLVVFRDCPPPDDAISRLSVDTNTRFACIASSSDGVRDETFYFKDKEGFSAWIGNHAAEFKYIGFLGSSYLPIGSWVLNAVRHFADPEVAAVCGPLIPGPFESWRDRCAGTISASKLSAGPDNYLYSFKRVRNADTCFMDNVFVRTDALVQMDTHGFSIDGRMMKKTNGAGVLRYDPDVAVSKPVPPLFLPYLGSVLEQAIAHGRGVARGSEPVGWCFFPTALFLLMTASALFLPAWWCGFTIGIYIGMVLTAAFATFDFPCMPAFVAGMALEHLVRAVVVPWGFVCGILGRGHITGRR